MPDTHVIRTVLDRHHRDGTRLVQILREIQEALGWLSPATLTRVAEEIGWPRAEVSGTASFYSFFHTRPRGKYCVLWSDNITDRMLGNADLMDAMCKKLWLEPGRVSEDGLVSVNTTSCTGMCDQGPALVGELPRRHAHDPATRGADGGTDPRRNAAGRMAGRMVCGRRQHPSSRDPARRRIRARLRLARRSRPGLGQRPRSLQHPLLPRVAAGRHRRADGDAR